MLPTVRSPDRLPNRLTACPTACIDRLTRRIWVRLNLGQADSSNMGQAQTLRRPIYCKGLASNT